MRDNDRVQLFSFGTFNSQELTPSSPVTSIAFIDSIYFHENSRVDSFRLTSNYVPEASRALLGLSGMGLLLRRRRNLE